MKCYWNACEKTNKENFNIFNRFMNNDLFISAIFACEEHKEKICRSLDTLTFEKIKPAHICGLILCKDCLNNLDEVLKY